MNSMSPQPEFSESREKMPALFVGHGSPMNAIEDNEFSRAWMETARSLPRPEAILCISAHWETSGTKATAMENPETIHDFYGFPQELFSHTYPAAGSPALARLLQQTVKSARIDLDMSWGLDHGAWSVLTRMFPKAGVPVVQLSLDRTKPPPYHYELGRALKPLRHHGVLIMGSGNIVHNLRYVCFEDRAHEWATEFDKTIRRLIVGGDHESIIGYTGLGRNAVLSIPTNEHFLPLLYVLGLQDPGEDPDFFTERVTYCSLSMRSFRLG